MTRSAISLALFAVLIAASTALPALPSNTAGRIVNGTATSIEKVPFQVSILFFASQWCGGTILDQNTILTAAHCFDYYYEGFYQPSAWSVRAGSSYWSEGGQLREISRITHHAQYVAATYDFDIALLRLATPLTYSTAVQPVALPKAGAELTAGQMIQVSGWGRLKHGGSVPDVLQKINLPVLSRSQCEQLFAKINPITSRMFCAGDLQGLGDSCNGDSGGPLVALDNTIFGIVSWGLECAQDGVTGVYTNLPYFLTWIEANRARA